MNKAKRQHIKGITLRAVRGILYCVISIMILLGIQLAVRILPINEYSNPGVMENVPRLPFTKMV